MDKKKIERAVWRLQRALLDERGWKEAPSFADAMKLLNPENVARVLGLSVEYVGEIPSAHYGYRAAGTLDRDAKLIQISMAFPSPEMRYTLAHELAHHVLHENQKMFRDRPQSWHPETLAKRPLVEAEADYFAALLLMPQRLLRQRFEETFRVSTPFVFDDAWAFHLCGSDPDSLMFDENAIWNRAYAIAKAQSFNLKQIVPLHEQFGVSRSAMARRLIEVDFFANEERPPAPQALFPAGLHVISEARLEEIFSHPFPRSSTRPGLVTRLRAFLKFVYEIGINCDIWLDGSLTTTKLNPNDVDLAVFIFPAQINFLDDARYAKLELLNDRAIMKERFECDVYYERADREDRKQYWLKEFGNGYGLLKGIPVVQIRT